MVDNSSSSKSRYSAVEFGFVRSCKGRYGLGYVCAGFYDFLYRNSGYDEIEKCRSEFSVLTFLYHRTRRRDWVTFMDLQ
jgi:hypothetical protein